MFFRLKSCYMLRGWEEMAWALVKRPENSVRPLAKDMFQVLLLCDGETEVSDFLLDKNLEKALLQCQTEGIVETSSYAYPLNPDQYYKYYHNRYIQSIFWSITGQCNFHCRHCYMDAPDAALGELSTKDALNFIDQMAECGVLQVDITGGEPFVRKDFWLLIDRILSYKIIISQIYTNGWLLNEKVLNKFEQRGIKPEIIISFDGIGWHDWMRGVSGAEKAVFRALKLCQDRGFPTSVGMCIHRGNKNSLPQSIKALNAVGVKKIKTANVDPTDLWQSRNEGALLTNIEYVEAMIPYITWYYEAGSPIECLEFSGVASLRQNEPGKLFIGHYDGTENCLDCYLCGATRWTCYITPEGRLLPCLPMTASPEQERFPKVQDIGLRQGLSDSYYMQFVNGRVKDLFEANKECGSCEYRYHCGGGCRAAALLDGEHNLMGCDRDMCTLWKGGYVDRIRKAVEQANKKYGLIK